MKACLLISSLVVIGACGSSAPEGGAAAPAEAAKQDVREATLRAPSDDRVGLARLHLGKDASISLGVAGVPDRVRGRPVWSLWLMTTRRAGYPVGYPLTGPAEGSLCFSDGKISRVRDFALKIAKDAKFIALSARPNNRRTRRDLLATRFARSEDPRPFRGREIASGRVRGHTSEVGIGSFCRP